MAWIYCSSHTWPRQQLRYHALPRTAPVPAVPHYTGPLLTRDSADTLRRAHDKGAADWQGSLDLGRSEDSVVLDADGFHFRGQPYPWPGKLKDRTLYYLSLIHI